MAMEPLSLREILNRVYVMPTKAEKFNALSNCISMMSLEMNSMDFYRLRNAMPAALAFFEDALVVLKAQYNYVSLLMQEDQQIGGAVMANPLGMAVDPLPVTDILNRVFLMPTKIEKLTALHSCIDMMRREVDMAVFYQFTNAIPMGFAFFMDALHELEIQYEHVLLFMDDDPPTGGAVMAVGVEQGGGGGGD